MKIGRRLAMKILNASRFVLSLPELEGEVTAPLDLALLARLEELVGEATTAFDSYDYARALERTEGFFWAFCDDYVELVKNRAYSGGSGGGSATTALRTTLSCLLRLFAPFLPFVTEEVWSWWEEGSVHRAPWPGPAGCGPESGAADGAVLDAVTAVLGEVRKAKSEAKLSQRAAVERVVVRDSRSRLDALRAAETDLREAGSIAHLVLEEGPDPSVDVRLAPLTAG
jgi:valyl-tRNA synthetase